MQMSGQELHLPQPVALVPGWGSQKQCKSVALLRTPEQKGLIEQFDSTFFRKGLSAIPSQEQQVAQVNDGQPKEQQLSKIQVSQYFMPCLNQLCKQAAHAELDGEDRALQG
jgi:hypothetical protein